MTIFHFRMITDPKSSQYITWTDLGTSFVVSNVGEFSRTILGSHFKHNNFSSFVRQLNMYGFHKINRTPRAQRTTSDSQTWEFSHHKFLRGRPDLLDEIKRKALEPDPMGVKMRLELPGEVAAQMNGLKDEITRLGDMLTDERRRNESLVGVVKGLWDVIGSMGVQGLPSFPQDLMEPLPSLDPTNPNIYITQPGTANGAQPRISLHTHQLHTISQAPSPGSSPTTTDYISSPFHGHAASVQPAYPDYRTHPPLPRQHSFQHLTYLPGTSAQGRVSDPPSPHNANSPALNDSEEAVGRLKRQRTMDPLPGMIEIHHHVHSTQSAASSPGLSAPPIPPPPGPPGPPQKRLSRARSDSAPLGYGGWQQQPHHGHHPYSRGRSGSVVAGGGGPVMPPMPRLLGSEPGLTAMGGGQPQDPSLDPMGGMR
ncbi:HSF-type DNA-binding-domain-containing protein [Flagelloscypha sp. PMI_526]|nr:HSF-type DNA-binding-domain-containing protein [Flagelloscypha sp. PMI_526]